MFCSVLLFCYNDFCVHYLSVCGVCQNTISVYFFIVVEDGVDCTFVNSLLSSI